MKPERRKEIGRKARKYTIENYSIEAIGKKLEDIIDAMPDVDYDFTWETDEGKKIKFEDLLDEGKRIAVMMPQSAGDVLWVNSLLSNLKELYPEYDIYGITSPQYASFFEDHPDVHKVLPFDPQLENLHFLEGQGEHNGYFDMAFLPHLGTQKFHNYHHNGIDKKQFQL